MVLAEVCLGMGDLATHKNIFQGTDDVIKLVLLLQCIGIFEIFAFTSAEPALQAKTCTSCIAIFATVLVAFR